MTDTSAMLPCPFCGSNDISYLDANDMMYCTNCGSEGPRPYDIGISTQKKRIENDVIIAWNTRTIIEQHQQPSVAALEAENERLREALHALCYKMHQGPENSRMWADKIEAILNREQEKP